MSQKIENQIVFSNEVINKRKLQGLMYLTFNNYGIVKSSIIADQIKNLTFYYATKSGISLSVEDLRVPFKKRKLIGLTNNEVEKTEQRYEIGDITSVERFQKVLDIWNNASNFLKEDVLTYFRESDPLNPLYIMAFSGARGNISQVRQLIGMRGLMADPQGQIIDLPIQSNFREGLKVTEYIISSYGARKGLVDTALRTADSGYLTRRLVDVAQDIIVREEECFTQDSLSREELLGSNNETILSIKNRLLGRLLAKPLIKNINGEIKTIYEANTELNSFVINKIHQLDFKEIYVRSPLTCKSNRSICRNCYGWHLSYSKLVDLGEAVGIIAAQSIGEPGTQLTMRTFHTGGVFSGDLTKQIRAPFSGTVRYIADFNTALVRTMHGEKGFNLLSEVSLFMEDNKGTKSSLKIPKGSTLLVNNGQKIYENQIIAEIKKDTNLIVEEDRKDILTEISGETFFRHIKIQSNIDKQGIISYISAESGLLWVLYGERYSFPKTTNIIPSVGKSFSAQSNLGQNKILNKYSGIIKFNPNNKNEILLMHFSMVLQNAFIRNDKKRDKNLIIKSLTGNKEFKLNVKPSIALKNGQTLAVLKDNFFKTKTGGIITYDLESPYNKKKQSTRKIFTGCLFWIPEETHQVSDYNNLNIKNGEIISRGVEILPNIFSKLSGITQINTATKEVTIKPGELFLIDKNTKFRANKFVHPGQPILPNIISQRLVYLESIILNEQHYLLVRPVKSFKVPREKGFDINHLFFPAIFVKDIKIKTVKRIFFKNWECVKSKTAISLLKTFLILDTHNNSDILKPQVQFISNKPNTNKIKLKLALIEKLNINDTNLHDLNANTAKIQTKAIVPNQFIARNTILAQTQICINIPGTVVAINNNSNSKELLVLKDKDIKRISYKGDSETLLVRAGDLVRVGTALTKKTISPYSGQIYATDNLYIYIRLGRPYLISEGTILRLNSGAVVQRADILATLVYDKLKTVDIVQGLPKVEEILEARKIKNECLLAPTSGQLLLRKGKIEILNSNGTSISLHLDAKSKLRYSNGNHVTVSEPLTDGAISPHDKLDILFAYYKERMPVHEACIKSFKCLQLFLVNEVQRTYLAQGVEIADKHIEIIVKQMTSKVQVEESGDTMLLPGEILNLNQAELATKASISANETPPLYVPMILGLTKASLNSDSFISAASFQETTRVLTEAAIEGKKDWLNGLKENVIIGRLIPAGTGFNSYDSLTELKEDTAEETTIYVDPNAKIRENILSFRIP